MRRLPLPARIGTILAAAGLVAVVWSTCWFFTRTFVPFDQAVSVENGSTLRANFKINSPGWYWVDLDLRDAPMSLPNCSESTIPTMSTLMRDGNPVPKQLGGLPDLAVSCITSGQIGLGKGRYQLSLQVLSDTQRLEDVHPHLRIEISDDDYRDYEDSCGLVVLSSLLGCVVGIVLLWQARPLLPSTKQAITGIAPFLTAGEVGRASLVAKSMRTRHRALWRATRWEGDSRIAFSISTPEGAFVNVGIVRAQTVLVILALCSLFLAGFRLTSMGLPVRVLGPRTVLTRNWGEGLVLRIDAQSRWYLNSEPVTPEELPALLRSKLGREPSWVVYLDGDSTIEFSEAARAIDIIRAEHAQVILLTSRSWQEIESKAAKKSR